VLALAGAWAAGVSLSLCRWLGGWLWLRRLLQEARPVASPLAELFAACRRELGLRRHVRLLCHRDVRSPVSLGPWRAVVVVPVDLAEQDDGLVRACLLHELEHLRRGDDRWAVLHALVRALFFFHPLVRWLLARQEEERELLCDQAALAGGADPLVLAHLLLAFARQGTRFAGAACSGVGIFENRKTLPVRIIHLMEHPMSPSSRIRWSPCKVALVGTALVLCLTLGSLTVRAWPGPEDPGRAEEKEPVRAPAGEGGGDGKSRPAARPNREMLRYGGKRFDSWRLEVQTELKPEVRADGIKALAIFAGRGYAKEATGVILDVLSEYPPPSFDKDDQKVYDASRTLCKAGDKIVPELAAALRSDNRNVRYYAADFLQYLGKRARPAQSALMAAVLDRDDLVGSAAIHAVGNLQVDAKEIVPVLVRALRQGGAKRRAAAGWVLSTCDRAEGRPAVPALLLALNDPSTDVRVAVLGALKNINPEPKTVVEELVKVVKSDKHRYCRLLAVMHLAALGREARPAVPALMAFLKEDLSNNDSAIDALAAIGPDARAALPLLREMATSETLGSTVLDKTRRAIHKIAPKSSPGQ
jgi:HEAT repeat protein